MRVAMGLCIEEGENKNKHALKYISYYQTLTIGLYSDFI